MNTKDVLLKLLDKWPEILGQAIGAMCRYIAIGALVHIGWKVVS